MAPVVAAAMIGAGATLAGGAAQAWATNRNTEEQAKLAREKAARVQEAVQRGEASYDKSLEQLERYRAGQTKFATPQMQQEYQSMIAGYNPEDYVYDFDKFEFGKSAEDYLDPYVDEIVQRAGTNVMHQYGKTGMGDSGFEQMAAFRAEADKMSELRQQAMEEYRQDRQFAYQEYSDYIANMQNKYNTMANLTINKINLLSGAIAHDEKQESDYMSDLLAVQTGRANLGIQGAMYT